MINGEDRILYILINDAYMPIACLTSNSFSESTETLNTTTRVSGGWSTHRNSTQSFSVDFEGLQIYSEETKASYLTLKKLKRERTIETFKIGNTNGQKNEIFKGTIINIGEAANVGEFLSFSGSIKGFGEPLFGDDEIFTFDSEVVTFDNNSITFDNT